METAVRHTVEVCRGKEYPTTITTMDGIQEIDVRGEKVLVSRLVIFESALGTSRVFIRVPAAEPTPEERARSRQRIIEVAQKALTDQGLW